MRLLIATRNRGKKAEYADLLAGLDLELMSLADLGIEEEVPEQGATFAENALAKARAYAALSGLVTLADDSGLEVDVLDGAPGVYSARYGGEGASDEDRYHRLLAELKGIPEARRTARFRCVIAVVWPDGRERIVAGACEGRIALEPRGEHGFGYDPVFYVPEYACTMAELTPDVKNRISHRARAAEAARPLLVEDLG
ncbi:MAG: XTP/dITP diphosphatase [Anaerolineae bacterium]|nr:XTP/dITP diphosphatase [Anaerolineae bacterium]